MDRFIADIARVDDDLVICADRGVAYQRDMEAPGVPYDDRYFGNYQRLEGQEIARKLNAGRVALVDKWAGCGARVVDVGIGSGAFIKSRKGPTFGVDVNPVAQAWLKGNGLWADDLSAFEAFSFWDVIEHIKEPDQYFRHIRSWAYLFTSIPIFGDINRVRESRHYKPGEHLYYWTEAGFVSWMAIYGFVLLERSDFETVAGRDSILSFAFRRGDP